jgi:2-desacetyl-2-hydroxyethyl bacteriochlorophyllide A dehydrogenase
MTHAPIIAQQLWFTAPHQVEIRSQLLPSLKDDELLVQTQCSAVSAGTEMLVYRNQIPADLALDASIESLQESTRYPLQYGYAAVGKVQQVGDGIDKSWLGKRVFSFQPHASHFIAKATQLMLVPDDISTEQAVFLPNMETAVNVVQDGNPAIGERVIVLGQGVVGLLLTGLLAQYPLAKLEVLDAIPARRDLAAQWGATQAFDPFAPADIANLKQSLASENRSGADLIYEVSGAPQALNLAIELTGFASRVVIGSWYGNKSAPIALGGDAHRNRLSFITSQVSSIAPNLSGRWDKNRRFDLVWKMIQKLQPERLISHKMPLTEAPQLYRSLDKNPEAIVQAVFIY